MRLIPGGIAEEGFVQPVVEADFRPLTCCETTLPSVNVVWRHEICPGMKGGRKQLNSVLGGLMS